jgi:hypothetical protein
VYIYLIHTHTHTPHTHTQEQINANSTRTLDMGTDAPEACTVVDHLARAVRSVAVRAVGTVSGDRLGRCRFELAVEDHEVLQVHVVGAHPALGDWNMENGLALEKEAGSSLWVAHAELPLKEDIGYKFVVWRAAREHSLGASTLRRLHIPTEGRKMVIKDRVGMEVLPEEKSKAFVRASPSSPALGGSGGSHSCLCTFDLHMEHANATSEALPQGLSVALVGSHEFLGEWQLARAVPMLLRQQNMFSVSMHLPVDTHLQYKFVVMAPPERESRERWVRLEGDWTVTRDSLSDTTGVVFPPPLVVRRLTWHERNADAQGEKVQDVPGDKQDQQLDAGMCICTFKVRGELESGVSVGIVGHVRGVGESEARDLCGNTDALGSWKRESCVRMQPMQEGGRTVHIASVSVKAGTRMEYRYVMLRAPRWEDYSGNRILSAEKGRLKPAICNWKMQRLDNVHLVRRVCDAVGGASARDLAAASGAPVMEAVEGEEGEWSIEPLDSSLCDTVLVTVVVEVAGLSAGDTVWMCGDDETLGEWPPMVHWPPKRQEPQALRLSPCQLSLGDGGGEFWQGLVRLRAGQEISYKYYVARNTSNGAAVCCEEGDVRQLRTPSSGRGAVFDRFQVPAPLPHVAGAWEARGGNEVSAPAGEHLVDSDKTTQTEEEVIEAIERGTRRARVHLDMRTMTPDVLEMGKTDALESEGSMMSHESERSQSPVKPLQDLSYDASQDQEHAQHRMAQVAIEAAQVSFEAAQVPTETAPELRFGDVTTEDVTDDVIDDVTDGVRPRDNHHDYERSGQAQEGTDTATDKMQDRMQEKEALECEEVQHSEASDVTPLDEDEVRSSVSQEADPKGVKVEFILEVHGLASDERVYLVGSDTALGCWEPKLAREMRRISDTSAASSPCGTWRCQVICHPCMPCMYADHVCHACILLLI